MKIVEIFNSIEGEGIRAGCICTFIRLSGCNLRCSYCDTVYSYDEKDGREYSIKEIIRECERFKCKKITVTGGEPLVHKNIEELLQRLCLLGYEVNIETNGSVPIQTDFLQDEIMYTMDYKCPSSGMENYMHKNNLENLREKDVLKFVVGNKKDLYKVCEIVNQYALRCHIFISPVYGKIMPSEIIDFMKENNLFNCRIQLQLHKLIWPHDMKGV